jgi:non-heme chloroperoxidase
MRLVPLLAAACAAVTMNIAADPIPAAAQGAPAFKPFAVKTPDGLTISAQEWGNPAGPEIVFIHGFMQSHLSWSKQFDSVLAREFRLVSYDVRGHGMSDKPLEARFYNETAPFADEVAAVLDTAQLKRPVLVGWSYGGRIIADYLKKYGDSRLAGIDFVAAAVSDDASLYGPARAFIPKAFADDLATSIQGTRDFLRGCFEKQPTAAEFETMLAFNAMVPITVRAALRRPSPYEDALKSVKVPTLVTHGAEDKIVAIAMGRYIAATVPGARPSFYDGIGHAPFWEDAPRFNAELAAFVKEARR